MTNQQYSHQRYQQHANKVPRCVCYDVCTSLAVCAHSFHSTTKREKVEHIEAQKLMSILLFELSSIFQDKQLENDKSTLFTPMIPTAR